MASRRPTTAQDILRAVQSTETEYKPLPGTKEKEVMSRFGLCMDECYPGLYIGDMWVQYIWYLSK